MAINQTETRILQTIMGGLPGGFRVMPRPFVGTLDSRHHRAALNLARYGLIRIDESTPGRCDTFTAYSGTQWAAMLAERESAQ